jgi:hypothetical protein
MGQMNFEKVNFRKYFIMFCKLIKNKLKNNLLMFYFFKIYYNNKK